MTLLSVWEKLSVRSNCPLLLAGKRSWFNTTLGTGGGGEEGDALTSPSSATEKPCVISFLQMSWSSNTWPPDAKSRLIRKDPDAGKDWRQEEKGRTEDEMVGWHHWLNGHEFEQAPGDGEGQGSLACCSSWGRKESDITERLSNNLESQVDMMYCTSL